MENGKWENIGCDLLDKRVILYTLTKLENAQILRNFDTSKDPDHDVFGNDGLK